MITEDWVWALYFEHSVDGGYHDCLLFKSYEGAALARRQDGFRPFPLVLDQNDYLEDCWFKPVYGDWEDEETWDNALESAKIGPKHVVPL